MDEKYTQFYNAVINQSIEVEDPTALDMCMDEIFKFCDILGIPRETVRHQYAYQVWYNATDITKQYFDLLPNTPSFIPKKGDIACFGRDDMIINGVKINGIPVGHVSVDTGNSDLHNLLTIDQNWDTLHYYHIDAYGNRVPYCRVVTHPQYYGCVGFLRAKNIPASIDYKALCQQIKQEVTNMDNDNIKVIKIRDLTATI